MIERGPVSRTVKVICSRTVVELRAPGRGEAVVIVDVNRRISEAIDPKSCMRTWNRSTAASTFASGLGEKPPVEW